MSKSNYKKSESKKKLKTCCFGHIFIVILYCKFNIFMLKNDLNCLNELSELDLK